MYKERTLYKKLIAQIESDLKEAKQDQERNNALIKMYEALPANSGGRIKIRTVVLSHKGEELDSQVQFIEFEEYAKMLDDHQIEDVMVNEFEITPYECLQALWRMTEMFDDEVEKIKIQKLEA